MSFSAPKFHVPADGVTFFTTRDLCTHLGLLPVDEVTADQIEPMGAFIVQIADQPDVPDRQVAEIEGEITHIDGVSSAEWVIRDKTEQELADEAALARSQMVVERWQLATACMLTGVITKEEAQAWAPGNALPASIAAGLDVALTDPAELAAAKIKALAAPRISRTNPLIEILRQAFILSEDQADDIFATASALA